MNDDAARNAIIAAFRAGDLHGAERASRELLASAPADPTALQVLGVIAYQRADWRQAVEWLGKTVAVTPKDASVRFNYAEALREAGDTAAAIGELRTTLALAPDHVPALVTLGRLLGESGDAGEALTLLDRAAARAPDDPKLFLVRGSLRLRTGQPGAADDLSRAARLDPGLALAHFYLGLAAVQDGDLTQADASLARVTEIDPASAPAYVERGKIASLRKQPTAAEALYRSALEHDNGKAETHALLAEALFDLRRRDEATEAIRNARALEPDNEFARLIEAKLARAAGEPPAARALLEPLLAETVEPNIAVDGAYELGHCFEAMGQPGDAFRWFATANERVAQLPETAAIDRAALPNRIAAMAAVPPAEASEDDDGRPPPHFVVGFPRSGTTLVEAILASHPAFVTSNEAPMVNRLIRGFDGDYPQLLETLSAADLAELRAAYWRDAEATLPGLAPDKRLIDKQPWNLVELPFIARLFPGARIVTVLRDPRDVCLSCFQQYFALNAGNVHFLTLDDTAAMYARTMGLWQTLRGAPWLTAREIRYEDVVGDFEATVAGLLEFLGAPWDDAVRAFPETAAGRIIGTPSRDAVTQDIYTASVGRWRRYEDRLSDILPTLDPFVEGFGYEKD